MLLGHADDLEAREYTLEGLPTGRTFTGNGVFSQLLDGTTDGVQFNYGIECCGFLSPNSVIVADLDWENSAELFVIPFQGAGITYDTRTNHLFTTSFDTTSVVREYDLSGTLIDSFTVAGASGTLVGLAYEQSTDTLWAKNDRSGTLYQFSKTGTLLDTVVVSGLAPSNDFGGEMRIRPMIDFESLEHEDDGGTIIGPNYTEDGFTVAGENLTTFGTLAPSFTGSTALFEDVPGGEIVLTRTDGGRFDIISIDLAELNGNQSPGVTVDFTGDRPDGGTVTQSFQLDGAAFGAEIFLFSSEFRDLTAVRWNQLSPLHQFDNIVVPEPSAALLHAAALLALAGLAAQRATRRRAL